jgi:hypothetical protein
MQWIRIEAKAMHIIRTMYDVMLVDISGIKRALLQTKVEKLETNSKVKNIRYLYRGINDIKKGYQARMYIVKNNKGDLVAHSHSILRGGTIFPGC